MIAVALAACKGTESPRQFTLTVQGAGTGTGTVRSAPAGINCTTTAGTTSGTCTTSYTGGTSVTLTATPAAGAVFSGWNGSGITCASSRPCVVTMDQARSVSATFGQQQFMLTVQGAGSGTGSVTSAPPGINCTSSAGTTSGTCAATYAGGTFVTLTATPAAGTVAGGWSGSGIGCPGTGPCTVTMDQARTVTATFARSFALTVQGGGGTGAVSSSPGGINCTIRAGTTSGTCRASYISGTLVTLAATPVAGGDFSGWSGACTGTGSCVLDMTADRAVTATFIGPAGPTVLVLTPKPLIVDAGAAAGTTVAVKDGSGSTIPNPTVTYVSRNSSVASVSGTGTVSGVTQGQAVVVATAQGGINPSDSLLAVVAVPGGPVLITDIAQFSYKTDTVFTVTVIMDMRASAELLGSTSVNVTWDPSVLVYQAHADGGSGVSPAVNTSYAASGLLTLTMADPNGFGGRVELLRITFSAGSASGNTGHLSLTTSEVTGAGTFTDLLARTVAVTQPLSTR